MAEIDVDTWRQSLVHTDETLVSEEPLSVADVYESCSSFFRDILAALSRDPSIEPSVVLSLRRAQSYLVLWADGLDIGDGMLDASLTRSKRARATTLRLISSVSNTLTERLLSHVKCDHGSQLTSKASELTHMAEQVKALSYEDRRPVFDSDTDSDTSSEGGDMSLDEIAEDLRTDTQCLLDLASRFQEPVIGPVTDEPAVDLGILNSWVPAQNFVNRIRQRYPLCDLGLAERLGNASWSRVRHCQDLKTENSRLRQQAAAQINNETLSQAASTMFHDSGLGTSVPALSEYAETVVSYDGGQGGSVRIPPLPEGAREGIPFECVGCGTMVVAKGKRTWKKHLFQDLRPYICLEDACPRNETPFATRQQWADHLSLEHSDTASPESVDCRICSQALTGSTWQITAHLARHLEEIALTVLPTSPDSEEGMDDDTPVSSADELQRDDVAKYSTKSSDISLLEYPGSDMGSERRSREVKVPRDAQLQARGKSPSASGPEESRSTGDRSPNMEQSRSLEGVNQYLPGDLVREHAREPAGLGLNMPASHSPSPRTAMAPQIHQTFVVQLQHIENQIRISHPNTPHEMVREMAKQLLQNRHQNLSQSAMNAAAGGGSGQQTIANGPHQYAQLLRAQQQAQQQQAQQAQQAQSAQQTQQTQQTAPSNYTILNIPHEMENDPQDYGPPPTSHPKQLDEERSYGRFHEDSRRESPSPISNRNTGSPPAPDSLNEPKNAAEIGDTESSGSTKMASNPPATVTTSRWASNDD